MIIEFHLKTHKDRYPRDYPGVKAMLVIDHTKIRQIYESPEGVTLLEDESGQVSEITESAKNASERVYKAQRGAC